MGFDFKSIVSNMEKTVAAKQAAKNPAGTYWVENQGQTIGPYQTKEHAQRRLQTERTIRRESGVKKDKQPELVFKPRALKKRARAMLPNGKPAPRVSPRANVGNSEDSEGWDYVTGRPVRKDSPAQRKMAPRGYYTGPGSKGGL